MSTQAKIIKKSVILFRVINPLTVKLFNRNFHPLEIVSRRRDPQLQVSKNSHLTKMEVNSFQILLVDVTFYLYLI